MGGFANHVWMASILALFEDLKKWLCLRSLSIPIFIFIIKSCLFQIKKTTTVKAAASSFLKSATRAKALATRADVVTA